jgi:hypothetical protein
MYMGSCLRTSLWPFVKTDPYLNDNTTTYILSLERTKQLTALPDVVSCEASGIVGQCGISAKESS